MGGGGGAFLASQKKAHGIVLKMVKGGTIAADLEMLG